MTSSAIRVDSLASVRFCRPPFAALAVTRAAMPVVVDAPDVTRTESSDDERDGDDTAALEEPEEDQGASRASTTAC